MKKFSYTIGFLVFGTFMLAGQVSAATGRILDKVEVELADVAALKAETQLFNTIGQSIALSIAQCELTSDCGKNMKRGEVDTLLNKINDRINFLVAKQQENSGTDYTDLLTAYADQRENYLKYQGKINALLPPEPVEPADATANPDIIDKSQEATTGAAPAPKIDLSIFNDVDEPLTDDPSLNEEVPPADNSAPKQQ